MVMALGSCVKWPYDSSHDYKKSPYVFIWCLYPIDFVILQSKEDREESPRNPYPAFKDVSKLTTKKSKVPKKVKS